MRPEQEDDFRAFARTAIPPLRRLAVAVARDRHTADDLVQTTLERMYVAWPRLGDLESPLAYARTTLVNALIDERRRWWHRSVRVAERVPDPGVVDVGIEGLGDRSAVLAALARLTPRQRAVVVLRHVDGLGVAETARITGLDESNVKAATREALAAMRSTLTDPPARPDGPSRRGTTSRTKEYAR